MTNSILGFSEDRVVQAMHDIERGVDYLVSEVVPEEKERYDLRFECNHELVSFIDDFCHRYEHGDLDLPAKISMFIDFFLDLAEKREEVKKRTKEMKAEENAKEKAKRDEEKALRKKVFEEKLVSLKTRYAQSVNNIRRRYTPALTDHESAYLDLLDMFDMYITDVRDVENIIKLWKDPYFSYYEHEYRNMLDEISRLYETKQMILEHVYQLFSKLSARTNEDDDDEADSILMNHVYGEDYAADNC